jgi:hypothetical protein
VLTNARPTFAGNVVCADAPPHGIVAANAAATVIARNFIETLRVTKARIVIGAVPAAITRMG